MSLKVLIVDDCLIDVCWWYFRHVDLSGTGGMSLAYVLTCVQVDNGAWPRCLTRIGKLRRPWHNSTITRIYLAQNQCYHLWEASNWCKYRHGSVVANPHRPMWVVPQLSSVSTVMRCDDITSLPDNSEKTRWLSKGSVQETRKASGTKYFLRRSSIHIYIYI